MSPKIRPSYDELLAHADDRPRLQSPIDIVPADVVEYPHGDPALLRWLRAPAAVSVQVALS